MRIPRVAGRVLVLASSIALLAGCASADVAAPTASADPTPSPTPTPVDVIETEPQTVFDGDCAQLLPTADADTIMGVAMTPGEQRFYDVGDVAIRQLGGIHCTWSESIATPEAFLSLVVLPDRAAGEPVENSCEPDYGCTFTSSTSGFTVFGVLSDGAAGDDLLPRVDAATSAFAAAVSTQDVPGEYSPASAWSVPIDCTTFDSAGAIAAALGAATAEGFATGGDAEPNPGFYNAQTEAGGALCSWSTDSGSFGASILPGGAWIADEIGAIDGARPITVTGVDTVVVVDDHIHFFDGDNWIAVGKSADAPLDDAALSDLATTLITELDARP